MEVTIMENIWAKVYYEFLEQNVPSVFFGQGSFNRLWQRLTEATRKREITFDWSKFDKTVPKSYN
jgi:hypothetical protein